MNRPDGKLIIHFDEDDTKVSSSRRPKSKNKSSITDIMEADAMDAYKKAVAAEDYQAAVHHLQLVINTVTAGRDSLNLWLHGAREDMAALKAAEGAKACATKKKASTAV